LTDYFLRFYKSITKKYIPVATVMSVEVVRNRHSLRIPKIPNAIVTVRYPNARKLRRLWNECSQT
jgi:hypothetical protein